MDKSAIFPLILINLTNSFLLQISMFIAIAGNVRKITISLHSTNKKCGWKPAFLKFYLVKLTLLAVH